LHATVNDAAVVSFVSGQVCCLLASIAWLVHVLDNPFKIPGAFLFMVHMKLSINVLLSFCLQY
jgi:hypothetical protein